MDTFNSTGNWHGLRPYDSFGFWSKWNVNWEKSSQKQKDQAKSSCMCFFQMSQKHARVSYVRITHKRVSAFFCCWLTFCFLPWNCSQPDNLWTCRWKFHCVHFCCHVDLESLLSGENHKYLDSAGCLNKRQEQTALSVSALVLTSNLKWTPQQCKFYTLATCRNVCKVWKWKFSKSCSCCAPACLGRWCSLSRTFCRLAYFFASIFALKVNVLCPLNLYTWTWSKTWEDLQISTVSDTQPGETLEWQICVVLVGGSTTISNSDFGQLLQ